MDEKAPKRAALARKPPEAVAAAASSRCLAIVRLARGALPLAFRPCKRRGSVLPNALSLLEHAGKRWRRRKGTLLSAVKGVHHLSRLPRKAEGKQEEARSHLLFLFLLFLLLCFRRLSLSLSLSLSLFGRPPLS